MIKEPDVLEKEANEFLAQGNVGQSYILFKKCGDIYKQKGNHKEAALCLASAASCWALKSGEKMFQKAAEAYEDAAHEAEKAGDLEYASLLYRQAAINYERDLEFLNFSECFYRSRECLRKFVTQSLFARQKINHISGAGIIKKDSAAGILKKAALCIALTFSAFIWGHGERCSRAIYSALLLILLSAFFYTQGNLISGGIVFKPGFIQALYFSIVTFTTVGYGDIAPIGITRLVATTEVFCAIFIMPIYIVGLSRQYLRT